MTEWLSAHMKVVHGLLAIAWLAQIPLAIVFGWIESIVYVSAISIYANVVGHWSGWSAERPSVE
jgi:hypothetical protein